MPQSRPMRSLWTSLILASLVACSSTPNRKPVAGGPLPGAGVADDSAGGQPRGAAPDSQDAEGPASEGRGASVASSETAAAADLPGADALVTPIGAQAPAGGGEAAEASLGLPKLGGDLLGEVAGTPLYASELLQAWLHYDSREVSRFLDKLVLDRLVVAEAKRLGIVLPPEALKEALATSRQVLEDEIEKAGGGSVEDFISRRMGLNPEGYLRRMEASKTVDLLASRCVRAFLLENDSVRARMIVATEREAADLVEAGLARGDDFSELARAYSKDPSGEEGGRIPPLVRAPSPIARLAFTTPVGEVGGPLFEAGRWMFLAVDGRDGGRSGGWAAFGAEIEAGLQQRPIDDLEFLQWQANMLERYEVDTSAFLELVGEPVGSNP